MEDNEIQNYHHCIFNLGVVCDPNNSNCSNCGWNPSVSIARLHRICSAMGIMVPEKATEEIESKEMYESGER